MFEKIFDEIFGCDWDNSTNEVEKENKNTNENNEDYSYFHKVEKKYENGNLISRVEKEIENGEVLKDINESFKIENKEECKDKEECKKKCVEEKKDNINVKYYEDKLREANNMLEEAQKTIKKQQKLLDDKTDTIKNLDAENKKLHDKIIKIKEIFG